MDTENFILKRRAIQDRLEARRATDFSSYPFRLGNVMGVQLPSWVRWALSLVPSGGLVSGVLRVGLPLALPFFLKKQPPLVTRLFAHFFPPKS